MGEVSVIAVHLYVLEFAVVVPIGHRIPLNMNRSPRTRKRKRRFTTPIPKKGKPYFYCLRVSPNLLPSFEVISMSVFLSTAN